MTGSVNNTGLAARPDLVVAVERLGASGPLRWDRDVAVDTEVVRVREPGLRDGIRARAVLREQSDDPGRLLVAIEVDALVADDAATARAELLRLGESLDGSDTLRYVGTVNGLLTLVLDLYTAGVADAVIVHPIDGDPTVARIADDVVPLLHQRMAAAGAA
ncbi:hypothetical protein [Williamsia sterculiae]|uniref:Luciferase-like monooxygenase n=1 Tax=Williamsia sterculiae TaxID=1344003 RepID=A0A1N7CR71_9NOCA|nr:hypothetical protein [Williamsia sterculiae]SIR65954.1 hypothetical protein SAMN05445060_0301 [Williamsia sterculiae]